MERFIPNKILKRVEYLAYSHELEQWKGKYSVELFLGQIKEQVWMDFLSYNLNIDYSTDLDQVFSSHKWISGFTNKILNSPQQNKVDYLMNQDIDEEPIPATRDRQAGFNLQKKQHSRLLNTNSEETNQVEEEEWRRASISK